MCVRKSVPVLEQMYWPGQDFGVGVGGSTSRDIGITRVRGRGVLKLSSSSTPHATKDIAPVLTGYVLIILF